MSASEVKTYDLKGIDYDYYQTTKLYKEPLNLVHFITFRSGDFGPIYDSRFAGKTFRVNFEQIG